MKSMSGLCHSLPTFLFTFILFGEMSVMDVRGLDFEPCSKTTFCEYSHCDTKHSAANLLVCNEKKGGLCSCKYDDDFGSDDYIRPDPSNKFCKNQTEGDCQKKCMDVSSSKFDGYLCRVRTGKYMCYCGRRRAAPETAKCNEFETGQYICQMANCYSGTATRVECAKDPDGVCLCRGREDHPLKPNWSNCWNATTKCKDKCGEMDGWVCPGNVPGTRLCYCSQKGSV